MQHDNFVKNYLETHFVHRVFDAIVVATGAGAGGGVIYFGKSTPSGHEVQLDDVTTTAGQGF